MTKLAAVVQQLKKEHDRLSRQLKGVAGVLAAFGAADGKSTGRRKISAVGRARIAAAQRARWAKMKGQSQKKRSPKKRASKGHYS